MPAVTFEREALTLESYGRQYVYYCVLKINVFNEVRYNEKIQMKESLQAHNRTGILELVNR